MKFDTDVWNSPFRMRKRIINLATMIATLSAITLYSAIALKSWLVIAIAIIYGLTTIPIFITHSRWQKEVPKPNGQERR